MRGRGRERERRSLTAERFLGVYDLGKYYCLLVLLSLFSASLSAPFLPAAPPSSLPPSCQFHNSHIVAKVNSVIK